MYEASGNLTDRVHIRFGSDSVTLESLHTADTHDRILDLCVQAIRGLGFHFKHPHDEIAEYENALVRIAENVEGEDPDPASPGDVVDAVYRAVQKLMDNRAEKRQTIADLREEVQDLKQIRDDLQLKVSTQQIGIDAQKARIEELTNRLQVLNGPICTKDDDTFRLKRGTFAWAMARVMSGQPVRRMIWSETTNPITRDAVQSFGTTITPEEFSATDWVLA